MDGVVCMICCSILNSTFFNRIFLFKKEEMHFNILHIYIYIYIYKALSSTYISPYYKQILSEQALKVLLTYRKLQTK
jgi:hypothetical protein